jgi:hypothetical protein
MGVRSPWHPHQLCWCFQYATSHTWIWHTLQFAMVHDIYNRLPPPQFVPNREHDRTIMDMALESS